MHDTDWLIIGGGPHGRFIATALQAADAGLHIAIIDPEPPLAAWQRRAAASGMQYLRSSNAHHLGRTAHSLKRFMAAHAYDARDLLGYYRRPSLALFDALADAELARPHQIQARAERIEPVEAGWRVSCDDGSRAVGRHVVLATGPGRPYRPPGLAACEHVFDADFTLGENGRATVIIGGGITGAQLALRARAAGHRVAWLTRQAPVTTDFDADPQYAGPKGMTPFLATPAAERTALLARARYPGTLPPDIHAAITAALAAGEITWIQGTPVATVIDGLRLADGRGIAAARVILATGFASQTAADTLLGRTLARLGLADDGQGHVPMNPALEIAPGLHVAGRAASLELGPMAGNIKGARRAGARLAGVARDEARSRSASSAFSAG